MEIQELIAPTLTGFFSKGGEKQGNKHPLNGIFAR
jgi:hypothetical protein